MICKKYFSYLNTWNMSVGETDVKEKKKSQAWISKSISCRWWERLFKHSWFLDNVLKHLIGKCPRSFFQISRGLVTSWCQLLFVLPLLERKIEVILHKAWKFFNNRNKFSTIFYKVNRLLILDCQMFLTVIKQITE